MNRFERMVAQWLINHIMILGWRVKPNLIELFTMIREKAEDKFPEDNTPTLDAFLQEAFDESKK